MRKQWLFWLWGMSAILALLLSVVDLTALDTGWYDRWYQQSDLSQILDVPEETIEEAMDMMLGYIRGDRPDMDGTLPGIGEVYNDREKAHMKDVRTLYQHAMLVRNIAWILTAAGLIWGLWKRKAPQLALGYLQALLCWVILFAFLGLWMATGFTDFWTHFHELFFDNDLWLLDPATDFMIRICPESMFFDLATRIVLWAVALTGTGGVIAWVVRHCVKR